MALFSRNSAFSRVTALAASRSVHAAFLWLHNHPKNIMDAQIEVASIPAPPFGEDERSEWLEARFRRIGLDLVHRDPLGNVYGLLHAPHLPAEATGPVVVLSAHIDTVFPASTPLEAHLDDHRLAIPGATDNCAGLAGLLALAESMVLSGIEPKVPILFLANVGEEGEGDLRGIRYFFSHTPLGTRVAALVALDGAGAEQTVTQALGSRRFRITVNGPGGHSFTDAGTANPITALASTLALLAQVELPEEPRTTMNFGTIAGGTSVNTIPESAEASVDFRSTEAAELDQLEATLRRILQESVDHWNQQAQANQTDGRGSLTAHIEKIGDRPAGRLPDDSPLLETLRAVDRHLNLETDLRLGSTDANIPLSLGIEALSMGAGGDGGGMHTLAEWYSDVDREIGLKRILLLLLASAEWAAEL